MEEILKILKNLSKLQHLCNRKYFVRWLRNPENAVIELIELIEIIFYVLVNGLTCFNLFVYESFAQIFLRNVMKRVKLREIGALLCYVHWLEEGSLIQFCRFLLFWKFTKKNIN